MPHENNTKVISSDTQSVLDHHLNAFSQGIEELMRDYDDRSIIITPDETLRGLKEIRRFFQDFLDNADPDFWTALSMKKIAVEGEIAYIAWVALPYVTIATDTLLIRDGVIITQTFTSVAGQ